MSQLGAVAAAQPRSNYPDEKAIGADLRSQAGSHGVKRTGPLGIETYLTVRRRLIEPCPVAVLQYDLYVLYTTKLRILVIPYPQDEIPVQRAPL
jgi:hypothetical protein